MRRKILVTAMNDEGNNKTTRPERLQSEEVVRLAKRLHGAANRTALALLPIVYLRSDPQVTGELVQKTFALTAVLSTLLDDLAVERFSRAGSENKDMWTDEHHEVLVSCLEKCHTVFTVIGKRVRITDEHQANLLGPKAGQKFIKVNHEGDELRPQGAIENCFRLASQTRLIVKHTCLTRFESLNTEEIHEALRLTGALQEPEFDSIWALKDIPFASARVRAILMPTFPATAIQTNLPSTGSLSSIRDLALSNHTKPIWACSNWPPSGGSLYPSDAATESGSDNNTNITTLPAASISDQKPEAGKAKSSSSPATKPKPKAEPGTVAFGEPSVIKPASSEKSLFGRDTPTGLFDNWKPSSFNAFKPTPHLEAYIVRPQVETTDMVTTLSHKIESLRLSEEVLQAHCEISGSDSPIMDVLLDLQPHVLDLIQSCAAQRQGNLVSVKHGKANNLTTSLGPLQVKPIWFVISTTTMLPQDPVTISAFPSASARSGPNPSVSGGLFDKALPTSGFGSSKNDLANPHISSPEAYTKYLQEQGQPCTYVERNETGNLQHFQAVTANQNWHNNDRSFEEIRLADYKTGRQEPVKTVDFPFQCNPAFTLGTPSSGHGSRSAQSVDVRHSKIGWYPTTLPSSTPGSTFPSSAPNTTSNLASNACAPTQGTPFGQKPSSTFADNVPGWIPVNSRVGDYCGTTTYPTRDQPKVTDANLPKVGTDSRGYCTLQHLHGPFCRLSPRENKTSSSEAPRAYNSTPSTASSAIDGPPKGSLFGGIVAINTTISPFGNLTSNPKNNPFDTAPPARDQSASFHFGPPNQEGAKLFSCSSPCSSGLFGQSSDTVTASVGGLFGRSDAADAPPRQGSTALEDYRRQLGEVENRNRASIKARSTIGKDPLEDPEINAYLRSNGMDVTKMKEQVSLLLGKDSTSSQSSGSEQPPGTANVSTPAAASLEGCSTSELREFPPSVVRSEPGQDHNE